MRAELGGITNAVADLPQGIPLCIMTDSRSLVDILRRWTRADFCPYMGDEDHDDILQVLLELIRSHGAPVHVVWVKAHRGDLGNYKADYYADLGCKAEDDVRFDRPSDPFQLWDLMAGTLLSPHGWKGKVQKHAEQFQTSLRYASLDTPDACWATASLVRDNRARDILGEVITDKSTPQLAVRDLLQA